MMREQVEPDTFDPTCHKIKQSIEVKLEALLQEYASQFSQDETSIGTTPLTDFDNRHRNLWASIAKTITNHHETLPMGEG